VHALITRPPAAAAYLWRAATTRPAGVVESNIRYLIVEVAPAAVLGAAAAFNSAFAVRLGASNAMVGLLSSLPALLAVLVLIPSGQVFARTVRRLPLISGSLFIHRLFFLLVALAPWAPGFPAGALVVGLLIASTPVANFFAVGWNSMLADVIPETRRARVFALRSILSGIIITGGVALCGLWLGVVHFPINYQVIYVVGWVVSLLSTHYITKLRMPDAVVPPAKPRQPLDWSAGRRQLRQAMSEHHDFVRILINTFLHGLGLWMVSPLYVLYFVRQLGATDGWIGLNGTLASLTPIIGFYLWQRGIIRWGENRVLKWVIVTLGLYPLTVGLAPGLTAILLCTAANGLIVPAINLSHFSMLLKVCPAEQRPLYLGVFSTVMNIGAFIMPLVGVYLAGIVGFAPVLVAGGVLCILGSGSFLLHPLRMQDSLAARRAERGGD
jgi:MFS family permease